MKFKRSYLLFPLSIPLLISLLVHTVFSVYLWLQKPPVPAVAIEVEMLDQNEFQKRTTPAQLKQIVQQSEKPLNDEKDDKAKFLSKFDQRVERETVAENFGKFQNDAKQGLAPKSATAEQTAPEKPQAKVAKQETAKKVRIHSDSLTGEVALPKMAQLKPQFDWSKTPAGVANPGPTSQTNDYLKEVAKGPQTLLSSREFIFYSYYARIKDRIGLFWEPKIKDKVRRILMSGRKIASDQERITKLLIVLNDKGGLIKVQVLGEAGIRDLDEAAIEAFQAAAPFPNPPKGIVEEDGTIKIQWDFILLEASAQAITRNI